MTARRWGSNFLGPYDGGYNGIAKREFKSHAIRAEFWHDAIEQELQGLMGSVEHCTTDQVRFVRQGRVDDLLPLRDVPPIVFSEAMRDVDLFVVGDLDRRRLRLARRRAGAPRPPGRVLAAGVGPAADRLGRDAARRARPPDPGARHRRPPVARPSAGSSSAATCARTGSISAAATSSWSRPTPTCASCRVAAVRRSKLFLPFDDDPTLSVILSKAFLLARDTKITDRSIVLQIRKG